MNQKLQAVKEKYKNSYHVNTVTDDYLELTGGGDFYYDRGGDPDEETWAEARKIAEEAGMVITDAHGEWEGWSEYTPDPGDVSVFNWRPIDAR